MNIFVLKNKTYGHLYVYDKYYGNASSGFRNLRDIIESKDVIQQEFEMDEEMFLDQEGIYPIPPNLEDCLSNSDIIFQGEYEHLNEEYLSNIIPEELI